MKIKLGITIIITICWYHSKILSQSKVEFIPTTINSPADFITFKNQIFFTAIENDLTQRKPYISDGTTTGTRLLKNINTPKSPYEKWIISGDKMFFIANDSINGTELWVTDGIENNTRLVKNISPKDTSTAFGNIHSLSNGKIYFSTSSNQSLKIQLWVSDGTEVGTYSFFETSSVQFRTDVFNNQMYYYFSEGLWMTDGTTNGSRLIKNLREPNTELGGILNSFVTIPGKFFFTTYASNGYRFWVSDGTSQGTFILDTLMSPIDYKIAMTDKVFMSGWSGSGNSYSEGLWVSDGSITGTKLLKKLSVIRNLTVLNNKILFAAYDSLSRNFALWTSDGTEAGTVIVKNDFSISVNPPFPNDGTTIPYTQPFYTLKNKAYFFANRATTTAGELYETDGTINGTNTLRSSPENRILRFNMSNATVLNDKLYLGLKEEIVGNPSNGIYKVGLYVISNPVSNIKNTEGVTDMKIYPTLTNDWLFVESPTFLIRRIRIIDMLGHIILIQNSYSHKADIPLNDLTKSIYLIQIETENGVITRKFYKL